MRPFLAVPAALVVLVAACGGADPTAGVDLPPASLPDSYETSSWAIDFSHDFPEGHWSEGRHTYTLALDCPAAMATPVSTDLLGFMTNSRTQVFDGDVYIRLVGLSTTQAGPRNLTTISTQQPTTAVVTLLGLDEGAATAATRCSGEMVYDSAFAVPLLPGEPFRP